MKSTAVRAGKTALHRFARWGMRWLVVAAIGFASGSYGFTLLGPLQDWMDIQKGFSRLDIGGPMNISEGYRWNIAKTVALRQRHFAFLYNNTVGTGADSNQRVLHRRAVSGRQ